MSISRALNEPRTTSPLRTTAAARVATETPVGAVGLFANPLVPMLTTVGVAALVLVCILTARSAGLVAALWGASGFAAAIWLRSGRGWGFDLCFGGLMMVGVAAGELLAGNNLSLTVMFTLANMLEIVAAVVLARRFAHTLNLATVNGACRFLFVAAIVAPIPAATFVAASLMWMTGDPFLVSFQTWWFGHALGLGVIAPMILSVDPRAVRVFHKPLRMAEWCVLFALLLLACYFVDFRLTVPLSFAFIPLLILIAARLRLAGVTIALVIVSICAVASVLVKATSYGTGEGLALHVLYLQLMLLFGYLPILLVASLLEERDRLSERAKAGQVRAEKASEAKSRLLANVAHEIKSPVGGVIGIGELWSTGQLGPVTPTQKEMADMLVKTARQVEALSYDLLDVARAESGAVKVELRPTDVSGLLEDVRRATALRPEGQSIRLEVVCEGDGLVALADSQRLAQVIGNLATNAIKYGASGGSVVFRARRIYDGVRIEVTDQGPGLSPEKQAQLFEPFNRLGLERSTIEGHGVGLALSKRLVELQGGAIGVESVPGQGATFWVELPAA